MVVQMDLQSFSTICSRSNGFIVAQTDLQSFKWIYSRSAKTLMKNVRMHKNPKASGELLEINAWEKFLHNK
ncbi:hypothetical protein [Planococcus sp. ISL-110]|uniref:hypothetical protein n=1 Tax=Planococcus sp. ISL-110 TaxID=2819167 RepID=UPI001BE5DC92|nr:hypothetical protein [Planococcus sp. ISL-110]MBT2569796.1 hypothetical protein [Planococcus sp. ISL-110]